MNRIFAAFARAVNAIGDENFKDTATIGTSLAHLAHPLCVQSSSFVYYEPAQFFSLALCTGWESASAANPEGCYLLGVGASLQDMDSQVGADSWTVYVVNVATGATIDSFPVTAAVPRVDWGWFSSPVAPTWYPSGVRIRVDTAGCLENKDAMLAVRVWTAKVVQA